MLTKLFTKQEYFYNMVKQDKNQIAQQQNDDNMIIELSSQDLRVNFACKGGNLYEASQNCHNLKSKISSVEFIGQTNPKTQTIITKLDNQCELACTVLNSQHMLYCQILFSNFNTSFSTAIKLFDFVQPDDCPTFDSRGKTNLCIDDIAWTNNDAFVLIIFSSNTIAILPRLGSELVQIFNPTIMNISQKMVDQFQHYKIPKRFNELILPMSVLQKNPSLKTQIQKKTISIHPYEDSFIISNDQISFVFRMDFEQQLTEIFSKTNLSFFFLRFCISLNRLSVDPEILEKIPQLLTNKLPLFEFEKNAELDEEEDPGQVIITASQINPYDNNARRMETNQSFNAEFNLECQTVLLNFKHLLMGLRWNQTPPLNYQQWLITVVNDCFFYFLKSSEPVYAFHALRMAEAYCKKNLFTTETDADLSVYEQRNMEFHSQRANTDYSSFDDIKRYFDAVNDMYDYHNTKEYMTKTTAEKLLVKYDMFNRMPVKLTKGSGNWKFQFSKNYTLLVYYSLIQFRNYQAANFNILFLVFACYIMQRYLDNMFSHHLQKIIEIVYRNFQMKKKSDDYELFLGKQGKNMIIGPPEKIKAYQDWTALVFKFQLAHLQPIYEQENFELVLDTIINEMNQNQEKIDKNVGYLGQNGRVFSVLNMLNSMKENRELIIEEVKSQAKLSNEIVKDPNEKEKMPGYMFMFGISLHLVSEYAKQNIIDKANKTLTTLKLIEILHQIAIKSEFKDSIPSSSYISNLFSEHFEASSFDQTKILPQLDNLSQQNLRQNLSVVYFYLNDIQRGLDILSSRENSKDDELFKFMMLSTVSKSSLRQLDSLTQAMKEKESKKFQNADYVNQQTQMTNLMQTFSQSMLNLKDTFQDFQDKSIQSSEDQLQKIWASLCLMPEHASLILREAQAHSQIQKAHKIMKFLKIQNPYLKKNLTFKEASQNDDSPQEYFTTHLIAQLYGQDSEHILKSLISDEKLIRLLKQSLTMGLIALIDYHSRQLILTLSNNDFKFTISHMPEQTENKTPITQLIIKDFNRLTKVSMYLECYIQMQRLEALFQQQINLLVLGKAISLDQCNQISYIKCLLTLALFEKYSQSQMLINKAFSMIKGLVCNDNANEILEIVKLVSYSQLNRHNKQSLASILEQSKQQKLQQLVLQLENLIFAEAASNPLDGILKLYQMKFIDIVNNNLDIKTHMQKGENYAKKMKMQLFERCLEVREIFGLSFDHSIYFDKSTYQLRFANIFGLSDSALNNFQTALNNQQEKRVRQLLSQLQQEKMLRNKQRQESKDSEGQHSFRGRNGIEIESARQYIVPESPGRQEQLENQFQYAKEFSQHLLKNRQNGIPATPKKGLIQLPLSLDKLIANDQKAKNSLKQDGTPMKRRESIHYENTEQGTAKFFKVTLRRDSARRQFVFLNSGSEEESQAKDTLQKGITQAKKGHRKGQMSVNPQGLNFRNQKFVESQFATQTNNQQKPGPPPGLPKAVHSKKPLPQIESTRNQNQDQKVQSIIAILQVQQNKRLKETFQQWSRQVKSTIQKPIIKQKLKQGSFNLMLVKKDGDKYTIKDAKEVMKSQSTQNNDKKVNHGSQQYPNLISGAKPFEFIRIQNNQSIGQPINFQSKEESKGDSIQQPAKLTQSQMSKLKVQKKQKSKEQYLQFIVSVKDQYFSKNSKKYQKRLKKSLRKQIL